MLDLLDQVEANLSTQEVSIVEFCESDDYCNKPLYPRQKVLLKLIFLEELTGEEEDILDYWIAGGVNGSEVRISPNIRQRVQYLKERNYKHFREIDLVGGRRGAKGFVTGQSMGKVMWDTLQLQDPGRFYGIDPDKNIYFSCVAGSEAQAREFQFADLAGCLESCKSFQSYPVRAMETEIRVSTSEDMRRMAAAKHRGSKSERDMARIRGKALAANAGTLRGSATMAICIDEMAHMIPGESKASADQVYTAAMPSLDQFGKDAIAFCNSSPYSKVGMFYDRNQIALREYNEEYAPGEQIGPDKHNGDPRVFTFEFPSWALFEGGERCKPRMKILTASPDWDPEEKNEDESDRWDEETKNAIISMRAEEAANPESFKVERRGKFAEVTDAYLNPAMVDRMYMGIPAGKDAGGKMQFERLDTNWGATAINIHDYKFHLDPSSTTAGFGFAIAHTEYFEGEDGSQVPHVVFDIIKRWNPKDYEGSTIPWHVVINEIKGYAQIFRPSEITFDQFQSAEPIQTLKYDLMELGIEHTNVYVKTATLEHNWFRAETAKTAINHGLVHAPNDTEDTELSSNELKFLQIKATGGRHPRVDKQDVGPVQTKDMADCIMECIESLIGNQLKNLMRERAVAAVVAPGAQGGFRIGGNREASIAELHPDLAGYYGANRRHGEQRDVGYATTPTRGVAGATRRGINRGLQRIQQSSRSRGGRRR